MRSLFANLRDGKYYQIFVFECRFFNNDLIRENLDQKDQIAQLNARVGGTSAYSHLYSQPVRSRERSHC